MSDYVDSLNDPIATALTDDEEPTIPPDSSTGQQFCDAGFHQMSELLEDALAEEDRIYRCCRCGAEWSPDDGEFL